MSLTLYFHPLSSFCHKVLIALYENGRPFKPQLVNLQDAEDRAAFLKLWPVGKFPVLRDDARGITLPESSIIIEYLDRHYPGRAPLIPADAEAALQVRLWDRFYDLHVHTHMQKIVGDRLRPADKKDPHGVADARTRMETAYGILEREMEKHAWAAGDTFSMADCAAAPALFYADKVAPFAQTHPRLADYLARLKARPSYARTLEEAQPYMRFFPKE